MFRALVLSAPFAILPLVAVQLVETLLRESVLPGLADAMQHAGPAQAGDAQVVP